MASFQSLQASVEVPINNWTYYRHASTFEEGALRGYAATVQAVGQTNYANSLAAVNFAEAYRRQIENSRSYVQTAIENRGASSAFENATAQPHSLGKSGNNFRGMVCQIG